MRDAAIPPADLPPRFRKLRLNTIDAVDYLREVHGLKIALATLARWRSTGAGPPFGRLGRVVYRRDQLDAWIAQRLGEAPADHSSA